MRPALLLIASAIALAGAAMLAAARVPGAMAARPSGATAAVARSLDDFAVPGKAGWEAAPAEGVKLELSAIPQPADLPAGAAAGTERRGAGVRLDFDFQGHGGYAIARRYLDLDLPANYELAFWVRGDAPPNNLEVKLLSASSCRPDAAAGECRPSTRDELPPLGAGAPADDVWWAVRRDFQVPRRWQRIVVKKRQLGFAWGPAGGGEIRHARALEIAISAGRGGRGTVELAGFTFEPLPPPHPYRLRPVATASSAAPGAGPALALDGDRRTGWHSLPPSPSPGREPAAGMPTSGERRRGGRGRPGQASGGQPGGEPAGGEDEQWLAIDFLERRELGGLAIDWDGEDFATRFEVATSADGAAWEVARTVARGGAGEGGRSDVWLPETDTRFLRLRLLASSRGRGYGIREVAVLPVEVSASPNAFFAELAREARRGSYPRSIRGEASLWTLVGIDGGHDQGLLDQDGRLEAGAGGFSVEPFVFAGGSLAGWSEVRATASLAAGWLPIPSVSWRRQGLACEVTAFAVGGGPPGGPVLVGRYRLRNRTSRPLRPRLLLVVRPFQVNPPAQFLGRPGGAVELRRIAFDGRAVAVTVGGEPVPRRLVPLAPAPSAFGAMSFDEGPIVDLLRRGRMPAAASVEDPFGYASAALAYDLRLAPGATGEVDVAIPLGGGAEAGRAGSPEAASGPAGEEQADANAVAQPGPDAPARVARVLARVAAVWRARLGGVAFRLPASAEPLVATLRTALAHILISRDGPALRPGTRAYARSWIRDGALISEALLRLGEARPVREFAAWYSAYQGAGGKVPCCVDARGADPVPENDSAGELLYLLASYYRYTGDSPFLEEQWSHVEGAVAYLDGLRRQRRTELYRQPGKLAFFGLLPESISHEGYSARPVHSYWDDFFALRGLADAAELARALGKDGLAARWAAMRDEFRADLLASVRRTIAARRLDYVPASVELGDLDPASTAIAVAPGGELADLPAAELRRTFERYDAGFERRRRGSGGWTSYTPYELRIAGTFVRLGWRERALRLLAAMMADRRPPGWNQWPEVVWRDRRYPGFLGDLPHAWVAAEYIRSFLDLFAYERDADHALVLAAGIPAAWAASGSGVAVSGLRTPFGTLAYTLTATRSAARLRIAGDGLRLPPGGLAIRWPFAGQATINGRPAPPASAAGGELVVRELPADVRLALR
jgi:F5/8 type C domain